LFVMKKIIFISFSFAFFFISSCKKITRDYKLPFHLSELRKNLSEEKNHFYRTIDSVAQDEKFLKKFFWLSSLLNLKEEKVKSILLRCDSSFLQNDDFVRSFLECSLTLFPTEFQEYYKKISRSTKSPKLFFMSLYGLHINGRDKESLMSEIINFKNNFTSKDDPILFYMSNIWFEKKSLNEKEIKEILKHNLFSHATIYVLFSKDRNQNGYIFVKKRDGKFLKESNKIFYTFVLGRSLSNMPSVITNGNTPCGVYSFQGFGLSDNNFIGIVPTILMYLPFEIAIKEYFHSVIEETEWNFELYKNILPENLRENPMLWEAFYAGKAGRNEIIIHGSTIDPEYYKNEKYYPFTPSLGCVTTFELWSEKYNMPIYSDQARLTNALKENKIDKGFVIVAEVEENLLNLPLLLKIISETDVSECDKK